MIQCVDCDLKVKNNRWAKTRAWDAGWFFAQDGRAWCPKHLPTWVNSWRKEKK